MGKVLILGAKGMLGGELLRVFGNEAEGWDREADITNEVDLRLKIKGFKPLAIINCAAYNDLEGAEENKDMAFKINAQAVGHLAEIAKDLGIPLAHFSTNYVFDGEKGEYAEDDEPHPLSVYAKSKYLGERLLLQKTDKFYLLRTAVVFGPRGESPGSKSSFVELMLDLSTKSDTIKAVADEVNSLTYATDLALAVKSIFENRLAYGIYHLTNSGEASWYDFAKQIFFITGRNINLVPVSSSEFPRKARHPKRPF